MFDFFVAVPGLGLASRELADMDRVAVDFSGGSTQIFHIGAASCAVPGAPVGLEDAHRSFGRLPWRDLFQPAIELARNGVELNNGQAYLHAILDLILRHTPESRAVYERKGERLVAEGERLLLAGQRHPVAVAGEEQQQPILRVEVGPGRQLV